MALHEARQKSARHGGLLKIVAEKFRAATHAGTIVLPTRTTRATARLVNRTPAFYDLAKRQL
jgi:hypothetical protein